MSTEKSRAQYELNAYTKAVKAAEHKRREWLQQNYMRFAEFEIGDKIYARIAANDYKLQYAGIVTKVTLNITDSGQYCSLVYKFEPHPTYHYGSDTTGGYSSFYTEEIWKAEKGLELKQLQQSLETGLPYTSGELLSSSKREAVVSESQDELNKRFLKTVILGEDENVNDQQ